MTEPEPPDPAKQHEAASDGHAVIARSRDEAGVRAERLARARRLGRRLRIEVAIDATGWLRTEVEIVIQREPNGAIRPLKVRVGDDATDEAILSHGGVVAECAHYNAVLGRLRQLAARVAHLVRDGRVGVAPGSTLAYAYAQLSRLDELITHRQRITMGHGTVLLTTLRRETEWFSRCDAHLAPIVMTGERTANPSPEREELGGRSAWRRLLGRGAQRTS